MKRIVDRYSQPKSLGLYLIELRVHADQSRSKRRKLLPDFKDTAPFRSRITVADRIE
jgi:hypothetical protein